MRELSRLTQKIYPPADLKSPGNPTTQPINFPFSAIPSRPGPSEALRYEMDSSDLGGILKNVRQRKQHSDFLLVTIHSHESADTTAPDPKNDFDESPADFVHVLAKAAIDAGADAFLTRQEFITSGQSNFIKDVLSITGSAISSGATCRSPCPPIFISSTRNH
mgnify:CR=1 FL=1